MFSSKKRSPFLFFLFLVLFGCSKKSEKKAKIPLSKEGLHLYEQIQSTIYADKERSVVLANQLKNLKEDSIAQLLGDYYTARIDYLMSTSSKNLSRLENIYPKLAKSKLNNILYEIDFTVFEYYYSNTNYGAAAKRFDLIAEYVFEPEMEAYRTALIHDQRPTVKTLETNEAIIELSSIIEKLEREEAWTPVLTELYYTLGRKHLSIGEREKAEEILSYTIEKSIENHFLIQAAKIYQFLSHNEKDHKAGIEYAKKAISTVEKTGYTDYLILSWRVLGHQYANIKDFESAYNAYEKSIHYGIISEAMPSVAIDYVYLGWAYFKIDADNNYNQAIKLIDKGIDLTEGKGLPYRIALERKRWIYGAIGQKKKAKEMAALLNEYNKNKPEQNSLKIRDYLLKNSLRFKVKDHQIKSLNTSNQLKAQRIRRQKYNTYAFFILGLTTLSLFLLYRQKNLLLEKNKKKELALVSLNRDLKRISQRIHSQNIELNESKQNIQDELKTKLTLLSRNLNIFEKLNEEIKNIPIDKGSRNNILKLIHQDYNKTLVKDIENQFSSTNEEFIEKLTTKHPDLTNNNVTLCVYLKMGLSSKEISAINYTAVPSVKVARSRLRKKLQLNNEARLVSYLNNL